MTEIESFKKNIEELARNFKAGSFDLKRLSEWVKLTSDDLLKTINQRDEAIKERDEARAEVDRLKGKLERSVKECVEALSESTRGQVARALLSQIDDALNAAGVPTLHPDIGAAERKPMLIRERVEWLAENRNEQCAEVEIWKGVVGKQSMKISAMEARPEPSRLEIAADLLCAWESSRDIVVPNCMKVALQMADELIAASKEEVGK